MRLHVCCDKTFVTTKIILGAAPASNTEKVSSMRTEQHLPLPWAGQEGHVLWKLAPWGLNSTYLYHEQGKKAMFCESWLHEDWTAPTFTMSRARRPCSVKAGSMRTEQHLPLPCAGQEGHVLWKLAPCGLNSTYLYHEQGKKAMFCESSLHEDWTAPTFTMSRARRPCSVKARSMRTEQHLPLPWAGQEGHVLWKLAPWGLNSTYLYHEQGKKAMFCESWFHADWTAPTFTMSRARRPCSVKARSMRTEQHLPLPWAGQEGHVLWKLAPWGLNSTYLYHEQGKKAMFCESWLHADWTAPTFTMSRARRPCSVKARSMRTEQHLPLPWAGQEGHVLWKLAPWGLNSTYLYHEQGKKAMFCESWLHEDWTAPTFTMSRARRPCSVKARSMRTEQHLPLQWAGSGTARGPSGGSGPSSVPPATWPPGGSTTHSAPPTPRWHQVLTRLCSCPPLKFDQKQPVALKHALRCGTAAGTWKHNWLYQGCWCKQNNTNTNNCLHYL